jgi:diguanylate cyclase (GGDEF)-like protein/PAS domain S-box-containing protein
MNGLFSLYNFQAGSVLFLISGLLASGFLGFVRRKRIAGAGVYLLLLLWAVAHWLFAGSLESAAATGDLKLFWRQVAMPASASCPVFFFLFALRYSLAGNFPARNWISLLFALPGVTLFLAITNERFHGLWSEILLKPETARLFFEPGPWFWVHVVYSSVLLFAGALLIIKRALRVSRNAVPQFFVLLAGALAPLVVTFLSFLRGTIGQAPDWMPLAFLFSAGMLTVGVTRLGILDLVPVARSLLVETMPDGVLVVEPRGGIADLNPAMASILGREREEIYGLMIEDAFRDWWGISDFFEGDGEGLAEVERVFPDGRKVPYEVKVSTLRDRRAKGRPVLMGKLFVFRDASLRRKVEEQLREAAAVDPLTGLMNIRAAYGLLEKLVMGKRSDGTIFSLALLDLDHFKRINDTLGHRAGDDFLEKFAALVRKSSVPGQVSARYGGDEFLIVFSDYSKREAEILLLGLLEEVRLSIRADPGRRILTGFSAGLVDTEEFPILSELTVEKLLEVADERLYQAKAAGRNRICADSPIGTGSKL